MKLIAIGFSKSKSKFNIFSALIRLFEDTPFSHTYVKILRDKRPYLVYQASGLQVNFMGQSHFLKKCSPLVEFLISVPDEDYKNFIDFAIETEGQPYSFKQVIGIFLYRKFNLKTSWLNQDGFVCSELVYTVLKKFMEGLEPNREILTPKDVYLVCCDIHQKLNKA